MKVFAMPRTAQKTQHSAASQEAILIPEDGVDFDAEMEKIEVAYLSAPLRRIGKKSGRCRHPPDREKW